MPLARQPETLYGVGENDRRTGVVDLPEGLIQGEEVMAAEIADREQDLVIRQRAQHRADLIGASVIPRQPLPQLYGRRPQQPLILRVAHGVHPNSQRRSAWTGEELVEEPSVLDRQHLPTRGGEHALQPWGADIRHDAVKRLSIEVDDPHHLAQFGYQRIDNRLPARA